MITTPDIIRLRNKKHNKRQQTPTNRAKNFILSFLAVVSIFIFISLLFFALVYNQITRDLPSIDLVPVLLDGPDGALLKPTQFFDRTGKTMLYTLQNPFAGAREAFEYGDDTSTSLPKVLIDATIAEVDPDYWNHPGFYLNDLSSSEPTTIQQRLVSRLLTWNEPPGLRKTLRERLLALQITNAFGREKIITWYLNSTNYGQLTYGASSAATLYFDKPVYELTLPEAAMLAAVGQAPALNPIDTFEAAVEGQQKIIRKMGEMGLITPESAQVALDEPVKIRSIPDTTVSVIDTYINLIIDQLSPYIPEDRLVQGGYNIITTLDADLQNQVVCALATQMQRLDSKTLLPDRDFKTCEISRLLPSFPELEATPPRDLGANAVILDPQTGQILSLAAIQLNQTPLRSLQLDEPGSLLTPYIYLKAFTQGYSPASLVWDIPSNLPDNAQDAKNLDQKFHGPSRIRIALANDYLVPALQLLSQIGAENVWQTAAQLGLDTLQASNGIEAQRLILEGGEISLLDISYAFGAFSTQGVLIGESDDTSKIEADSQEPVLPLRPIAIIRVEDTQGNLVRDFSIPQTRPVISTQLAFLITNIMSDEAARWPSLGHPNSLEIGRPVAVKTGFSQDEQSAWTVGFTPQRVSGVWVGRTSPSSGENQFHLPLEVTMGLWHAILKYASQDLPAENWQTPAGITGIDVCDPSGLLPTIDCPTVVREIFAPGTEPTHYDNLFKRFQINRETGNLATVFTPPGLIETHVYMEFPPEAASWAQTAGLPSPPKTFDRLSEFPESSNAQIISPIMFSYIRGKIPIVGTATGSGFQNYQVQVGQGLNPQHWLVINQESNQPVENGTLATWNTESLNGLYAIRLQVIDADNRIDTAITQITIDNLPPFVNFTYPSEGQEISFKPGQEITLQIQASDNIGLEKIEFYIEDILKETLTQSPYVVPFELTTLGPISLKARAYDLAGNISESVVTFRVR